MDQDPHVDRPRDNLSFLLWQTNMTWHRQLNRALDEIGLTHTQFAILSALRSLLKDSNTVTQKAIAERVSTDTMMVSKVLRTLEKKGAVQRKPHKTDTRAKCVFLTPQGKSTFLDAFRIASAANNAFFGQLADKDSFKQELQRIVQIDRIL